MSAFKGADVIVRKTRQLIARRLVGPDHTPGTRLAMNGCTLRTMTSAPLKSHAIFIVRRKLWLNV
jgi:hypothetical protein